MEYRIFNVRTWLCLCERVDTGVVGHSDSESAQLVDSEKLSNICLVPLTVPGFELRVFGSRIRRSTNWATPSSSVISVQICSVSSVISVQICSVSSVIIVQICSVSSVISVKICSVSSVISVQICSVSSVISVQICSASSVISVQICSVSSLL